MTYLQILSYYLIVGLIIALVVEFCVNRVEKFLTESNDEDSILPWGNLERTITIIIWPYTIIIFAIAIVKFIIKNPK